METTKSLWKSRVRSWNQRECEFKIPPPPFCSQGTQRACQIPNPNSLPYTVSRGYSGSSM